MCVVFLPPEIYFNRMNKKAHIWMEAVLLFLHMHYEGVGNPEEVLVRLLESTSLAPLIFLMLDLQALSLKTFVIFPNRPVTSTPILDSNGKVYSGGEVCSMARTYLWLPPWSYMYTTSCSAFKESLSTSVQCRALLWIVSPNTSELWRWLDIRKLERCWNIQSDTAPRAVGVFH